MRNWHITTISYRARDGKKKTLYRVDGEIDGKRYRKAFGDRKLANEHMAQKVADGAEQDELPRQALLTSLTQAKLTTVEQALARLRNAGCDRDTDILEAVTQYIERRTEQAALTSKRLGDAILEFVIDKKNNGRSEATLDGLNSRLRRFASEMFGVEFGRDNEGQRKPWPRERRLWCPTQTPRQSKTGWRGSPSWSPRKRNVRFCRIFSTGAFSPATSRRVLSQEQTRSSRPRRFRKFSRLNVLQRCWPSRGITNTA